MGGMAIFKPIYAKKSYKKASNTLKKPYFVNEEIPPPPQWSLETGQGE